MRNTQDSDTRLKVRFMDGFGQSENNTQIQNSNNNDTDRDKESPQSAADQPYGFIKSF